MRISFILAALLCTITASAQQVSLKVSKDTVKIVNAELVLENSTKQKNGFLYNKNNGLTSFENLGNIIQFKVGAANVPAAGASVFSDGSLANRLVKVWRNGLLQHRDYARGISVDASTGTITFYPKLAANERIYIEATAGYETGQTQAPGSAVSNLKQVYAGIFDNGNNTFVLRWASNHTTLYHNPRVVGIGSSTLAGYALTYPNRLGDRINFWLNASTIAPVWLNYAVSGYTTANVMPQSMNGVSGHNIEMALSVNPDILIICLPTNDANEYPVAQSMANLRFVDNLARKAGIPAIIETTQPRSTYGSDVQLKLLAFADSIRSAFPDRYAEGMIPLRDTLSAKPANIFPLYDGGDGAHLTPAGIQLVANSFFSTLKNYFQPITGVSRYVIDTSYDGNNWAQFDVVTNPNTVKKTYNKPRNGLLYFRVKAQLADSTILISDVNTLAPPLAGGNNFDHRILVDLGGDGMTTINAESRGDGQLAPSPDQWGKRWNNWTGGANGRGFVDSLKISDLVTTTGRVTSVSISLIGSPGAGYGTTSTQALNFTGNKTVVGDYPIQVVSDNMYIYNNGTPTSNYNIPIRLRIKGMIPGCQYRIKLWGSRGDDGVSSRIMESILSTGEWTAPADIKKMETKYPVGEPGDYNNAIIHNITGVDSIDVLVRPSQNSGFTHLSLIDIGITGELPQGPEIVMNDTTLTLPSSQLAVAPVIIDNNIPVNQYQWSLVSGPSTPGMSSSTTANTIISGLTNGVYVFRLKLVTSTGVVSKDLQVTVLPDNGGKKTLRVHFSKTEAPYVPGWMNVFGEPGKLNSPRITKTDPVTGWLIDNIKSGAEGYWVELSGASSSNTDGATTLNNSGYVPDIVLKGYWFNYSGYTPNIHNLKIGNLNPAKQYTIILVPSRANNVTGKRSGYYAVNGGTQEGLNALGNTTEKVTFPNISPDENGRIYLDVHAPLGGAINNWGNLSYLNALIIQEQ
ncbi:SGNH/GDSL hydrolase family protein [uncultured Chitinophaga sp.]|uniref:SGNH/GDSL hydrolase family protein n=1 Tax=uncultured Chitinophaga sp. TaxID=339340 RepID=UPI0025E24613|nr:SGNH/GDSL hydrolase family protein [uncultured Chitinophaga sp.]